MKRLALFAVVALIALPAHAVECKTNEGKQVVYALATGPTGKEYLPIVRIGDVATETVAFPLRVISEQCTREPENTFLLQDFPGTYASPAAILEILHHLQKIHRLGLKDAYDLKSAMSLVNDVVSESGDGGGN